MFAFFFLFQQKCIVNKIRKKWNANDKVIIDLKTFFK